MNEAEANALDAYIRARYALNPIVHQIGNREYILIIDHLFLWSAQDWEKHKGQWHKMRYVLEEMR